MNLDHAIEFAESGQTTGGQTTETALAVLAQAGRDLICLRSIGKFILSMFETTIDEAGIDAEETLIKFSAGDAIAEIPMRKTLDKFSALLDGKEAA